MRRFVFCLLILVFAGFESFSQMAALRNADLSVQKPSWQAAIGGEAVAPAVETSYGIVVLSDGRMLNACTADGKVIWQQAVKGRPSPFMTAFGDFLYVVTSEKKLNFVNPSGVTIWTADNPFSIVESPTLGLDGRVFVRGKNRLACYGLNGIMRWQTETPEQADLPLSVLNDGSILVYMRNLRDGKTVAKRFSAFGGAEEDLIFSDEVVSAVSSEQGILVGLKNGSIGLCAVRDGFADSRWVQKSYFPSGAFSICYSKSSKYSAFFFKTGSSISVIIVNTEDGEFINQFTLGAVDVNSIQQTRATDSGFFIADSSNAYEFMEDGTILWAGKLPSKSKWNYLVYTKTCYLIFCNKNWIVDSFRMNQAISREENVSIGKKSVSIIKVDEKTSSSEFGMHSLTEEELTELCKIMSEGNYGIREEEYMTKIKTEAQNYVNSLNFISSNTKTTSTYFEENPLYTRKLFYLMSLTGSEEFVSYFATLIKSEKNMSLLTQLIAYSGKIGYDPYGELLTAYHYVMKSRVLPSDVPVLMNICDSVYEICKFMGRPAFYNYGREIISLMFFPRYDKKVRDYARDTLKRIADLKM